MSHTIYNMLLTLFLALGASGLSSAQKISGHLSGRIENEILQIFEQSIKAGEELDIKGISANISDTLKAGFIDNGYYFRTFNELMDGFKSGTGGVEYQKINVEAKKVTVLSDSSALLTAHGNYSAKITDGRVLTGKFAWTFIYFKVDGKWKVIHSHMSNPQS